MHPKEILKKLSRTTSSGRYFPLVDGMRFLAIAWVILYHLYGFTLESLPSGFADDPNKTIWGHFLSIGHFGVPLFFAISGFILALPYAKNYINGTPPVKVSTYLWRRVTRLEPPYIFVLFLFFFLLVLTGKEDFSDLLPHLGASLLYSHGIIYGTASPINPVLWSLEIEIQFYLLVPLLTQVFRFKPVIRRSLMASSLILFPLLQHRFNISGSTILGHAQYFISGFLLVDLYLCEMAQKPVSRFRWDIASALSFALIPISFLAPGWEKVILPIIVFSLYFSLFNSKYMKTLLSNVLITTIGGMAYTIYLTHLQIISAVGRITKNFEISEYFLPNFLFQCVIAIPIIISICAIFFYLIEKPCMDKDWLQKVKERLFLTQSSSP